MIEIPTFAKTCDTLNKRLWKDWGKKKSADRNRPTKTTQKNQELKK